MLQVYTFFKKLLSTDGFPPRWHCGNWTDFHGWLYIVSDLLIWSAYFVIPIVIVRYITLKSKSRFSRLYFLFAAFILACGATHLLDAIIFWYPYYRLSALAKFVTGILSWVTVFYIVRYLPIAFSLKTSAQLEEEMELRKSAEQQLLEGNKMLQAAQDDLKEVLAREKEVSDLKSKFVSIASHEFRTPLAGVQSSAYLLSKYTKEDQQPQRDKHIHRIISAVLQMNETLNDFLSLDKIEQGTVIPNLSPNNIHKLTEEIIQDTQHVLKKGQSFDYDHAGDNEDFALDASMFKHVLTNLLSNAAKYSPENSGISIHTEKNNGRLQLTVTDRGIGIPAEDQEKMFSRFFRSTNAMHTQGTGLGLNIVKRYVEIMNGDIRFTSEVNKGTTFIITLMSES